jgi:hypothetical protein
METFTKLFLSPTAAKTTFRNYFIRVAFLAIFMMASATASAVDYCATPVTNTTGAFTANFTCRKVATSTFEFKLEFANTTTGTINAANCWLDNTGGANIQIGSLTPVWSNANKTVTYTITIPSATNTPNLYVANVYVIIGGVERQWNLPTNENFAATCVTTPVLTTTAPTGIGADVGTMNGNISSSGASNITEYGFYWSTTNGFANGTGTQIVKGNTNFNGDISHELTGLTPGASYYYKAYATNGSGTAYGAQQTLTTTSSNPPPTFGSFTIPAKTLGDVDFDIPAVTTDSGGTITYTSDTPGVATIVNGNQIHIVGVGTSLITLNQAADATHAAGSTSATLTVTLAAAPTPPARNAWDVISLYSGAYTTLAGVVHQHGTEVSLAGNPTRYIENMLLSRMAFAPTNFSAMTTLHADVYCTTIGTIWLQFQGGSVTKTVTASGWQSIDIPLTDYPGVNFTNVSFFDLNNPTGVGAPQDNVYVDNVYFYRPATSLPPTLGSFSVPTKNLGDADFEITPPTSNSAGSWSYSSSNTGVATIVSGNMIHIVGPGSSTITATQAADGVYGQGVATATFTVNYPDPPASPIQPARNSEDVISLFASAYSDIAGTNFNPNWGQASNYPNNLTTPTYSGDQVKRYLNSGTYQGTGFTAQDVTVINKLHVDLYSYSMTSLRISLINEGIIEAAYTVALTPNTWNSIVIDVNNTNFPGVNLTAVNQLKYDQFKIGAAETGGQVLIVDNLYFYRETNVPPTLGEFTVGPNLLGDADYAITPPTSDSAGAWSYTSSNPAVATIAGGTHIHIVGAGTSTITATQAADGIYALASTTATLTVTVPPLTTAAPTPPARNDWDVISLYSEAYPTLVGAAWQFGTDVALEGNATRYIENMLLARLAFPPTNVSAMTHLHIDFYSETLNPTWFELGGNRVTKSTPVNGWVSLDIPLSEFVGLNLTNVNFFDLNNPTGAVAPADNVYVDNVYFYRPATSIPPTLSDFSVPTKAYNDPDFEITPPTSNSAGAFSYTSSNTNVATIVNGNMIHIVGGGTTTITANQAADGGSYGTGSITAPFTVTFAPPGASPIPPARTPDRVFSMFTGNPPVYADSVTASATAWSNATMTEVPNGTNTALQLNNFGVLGLTDQGETHFDISGMSHLHIDFYLDEPLNANPSLSRINMFLLANGDYLYPVSNLVTGWNSISIPLADFGAANLADAWGLKLENINPPTQIYIDNVYFSNECYTYYADNDNDTYGDPANTQDVCDGSGAPSGYVTNSDDCDDTRNNVHPGGVEIGYNLMDDDCDGLTDEGFVPKVTTIQSAQCNTVLAAINSQLTANLVAGAQGYRWRITTMSGASAGQIQELATSLRVMKLTQLPTYAFDTQYKVEVAVYFAGFLQPFTASNCIVTTPSPTTTLASCGQTLTAMTNVIYANIVSYVTGYRFRITDPINALNTQTIDRPIRDFRMSQITNFVVQYGKTYNVEVALRNTDGTYLPYGTVCQVTTPVFPTTSLQDSQCDGYMVPNANTPIYAGSHPGAIAYVFQLSGGGLPAPIEVTKSLRVFTLNDFAGQLTPGATYNVKVRLIFNLEDPIGPYGKTCSITVPGASRITIDKDVFDAVAYPNPFAESFNIDITTTMDQDVNISIYDMTGRLLQNTNVSTSKAASLTVGQEFPSGIYNVIVRQGDTVKTLRVIKR